MGKKSGASIPKISNKELEECSVNKTASHDSKDSINEPHENSSIETKKKKKSKNKLNKNISNDDMNNMISSTKKSSKKENGNKDDTKIMPISKEIEDNSNDSSDQKNVQISKTKVISNECIKENGKKNKSKKDDTTNSTFNGNEPDVSNAMFPESINHL